MANPPDVGQPQQPVFESKPGYPYQYPTIPSGVYGYMSGTVDTTMLAGRHIPGMDYDPRPDQQQKNFMKIRDSVGATPPAPVKWTNPGEYHDFPDRTYS